MKTLFITVLMTTSLIVNGQNMKDKISIQETISKMFVNSDQRNWEDVEAQFAKNVMLDYSSMTGNPATTVTPKDITNAWKTVLPGFTFTHHQIGNFITEVSGVKAHSFCYGTATHYLEDDKGNIWTVVGSYDFELEQSGNDWKITTMTFNYKYQDGNAKLIEKAIENVKTN
ncbi:nuclear transport factor 2 family protein [Winogradskyella sp. 3972H.M.0a.05]|uniref:nuclear transport factor 2 family protein n=1 Tax=Winogradskyella sp. 3972H.M.0a.05 TaxID=2950277 RepID=UPI0033977400